MQFKNIASSSRSYYSRKVFKHFTKEDGKSSYPWVHLDIAGSAFLKSEFFYTQIGTGTGVRLLTEILSTIANDKTVI